jgi:RNA polymerase sigma factor (TIGR02999 family)
MYMLTAPAPHGDVTVLLRSWRAGDQSALNELTGLVYPELRRLAAAIMRQERGSHTLQPTALVHEVYLRITADQHLSLEDRAHFLGIAARLMRQVLIEHARRKFSAKRGGRAQHVTFEDGLAISPEGSEEVIALDAALSALHTISPRKAQAVEMRYFGGLTVPEIAAALDMSSRTVERDLRLAHAWLFRHMQGLAI